MLSAVRGCGWCKLIHDLDPTPVGITWFWLVLKYANESTFTFSGYHTSWPHMTFDIHLWPLTLWTCKSFHIISIMYHDSPIALCTSRSRSRTGKQNKPNLVPTGLFKIQLFKWGEFYILGTSYNLTSDDLRPWYRVSQKCRTCLRPYISKIIARYVNFKTSLERKKTLGKLFWYQIQLNLQHLCTLRWPYCLTIIGCNFVLNDLLHQTLISHNGP